MERKRKGFDISTYDGSYLSKMESKYGVKMEEEDRQYRDDPVCPPPLFCSFSFINCPQMSGARKMFCEHFADKKWLAMMERRSRRGVESVVKGAVSDKGGTG